MQQTYDVASGDPRLSYMQNTTWLVYSTCAFAADGPRHGK